MKVVPVIVKYLLNIKKNGRDYPFNAYAKFPEKLTFLPTDTHMTHVRIRG